jgi:hypothetical protein
MGGSENSNAEIAARPDRERATSHARCRPLRLIAGPGRLGDVERHACQTVEAYRAMFAFGLHGCAPESVDAVPTILQDLGWPRHDPRYAQPTRKSEKSTEFLKLVVHIQAWRAGVRIKELR